MEIWKKALCGVIATTALGTIALMPTDDVQANLPGHNSTWECRAGTECLERRSVTSISAHNSLVRIESWIDQRSGTVTIQHGRQWVQGTGVRTMQSGWRSVPPGADSLNWSARGSSRRV